MSVATSVVPFLPSRYFDALGVSLSGARIYFFVAGSVVPLTTYSNSLGTVANTHPVVADSNGVARIFLPSVAFDISVRDSNDVQLFSESNVLPNADPSVNLANCTDVTLGDGLIAYRQPVGFASSVCRTVHGRWTDEPLSIIDYGADPTGAVDSAAAIQAAIDSLPLNSNGEKYGHIFMPTGTYKISSLITLQSCRGVTFSGNGKKATTLLMSNAGAARDMFRLFGVRDSRFNDFSIIGTPSAKIDAGFSLETKSGIAMTGIVFENIDLTGTNKSGADVGLVDGYRAVIGSGGDNNNDGHKWYNCEVANYSNAAWNQASNRQAKSWLFVGSSPSGDKSYSLYGWYGEALSIKVIASQGGGVINAVFWNNTNANNPGIDVDACGFENAGRLLYCPGSNNMQPCKISNTRFSPNGILNADGKAVLYGYLGPFLMENCQFEHDVNTPAQSWQIGSGFSTSASGIVGRPPGGIAVMNCVIASTLTNPFVSGFIPSVLLNNAIDRTFGPGPFFQLPNFVRPATQGESIAAANALTAPLAYGFMTVTGNTEIQRITFNDGRPFGQELTMVFTGTPTVKHNQAPTASAAAILLEGSADWTATAGSMLTLTLWDNGAGTPYWIQKNRTTL